MAEVTFELLQKALVDGNITMEQFVQVLLDNFGPQETFRLMKPIFDEALNEPL